MEVVGEPDRSRWIQLMANIHPMFSRRGFLFRRGTARVAPAGVDAAYRYICSRRNCRCSISVHRTGEEYSIVADITTPHLHGPNPGAVDAKIASTRARGFVVLYVQADNSQPHHHLPSPLAPFRRNAIVTYRRVLVDQPQSTSSDDDSSILNAPSSDDESSASTAERRSASPPPRSEELPQRPTAAALERPRPGGGRQQSGLLQPNLRAEAVPGPSGAPAASFTPQQRGWGVQLQPNQEPRITDTNLLRMLRIDPELAGLVSYEAYMEQFYWDLEQRERENDEPHPFQRPARAAQVRPTTRHLPNQPSNRRLSDDRTCTICTDPPQDPVWCPSCRQLIGCRPCLRRWLEAAEHRTARRCPLCRAHWRSKWGI
ncbi:unnamed protein product [Bursaphelenchus xylophilus]|uniref:(pine wood nematode) hypothetical protein n=1 Tax=Bursaphelenchus xylophilus TaxID=6326 RepID=A0A7I8XDY0_BURXY|nr:unnamed protein product [Bursaphelenchus xylophilus]CAG9113782.1 unnamed protein product [Bursaphelenchus xylophilus]